MNLNIKTEFNAGDTVYYIENNEIKSAKILGVSIYHCNGEYFDTQESTSIKYFLDLPFKSIFSEWKAKRTFFRTRKELINYLTSK